MKILNAVKWYMKIKSQSGQIVVEYVLLLFVVITIATLITKSLVSREVGAEGSIIKAWNQMITSIGNDDAGEVN